MIIAGINKKYEKVDRNYEYFYTMYLKKTIVAILIVLTTIATALAQQVYQVRHYGDPGTIYLYNVAAGILPSDQLMQNGEDLLWDVSAFSGLNTSPALITTPGQAMDQTTFITVCVLSGINFFECLNIWSQTDRALVRQDSFSISGFSLENLQRFQNKTSSLLLENFFGFSVDAGEPIQAAIVYQQPDTIYRFPIAYGSAWTSTINWIFDLSLTGQPLVYKSHQIRTATADAWGTIITPYDTFTNVVRLRSAIEHQDTIVSDSLVLPFAITQVEYTWFDTLYKLPVMIANGIANDTMEIISTLEYIYEATCPVPTWSVVTVSDVYYIDSSGHVNVDFLVNDPNAGVYNWDFDDGMTTTTGGSTSHSYTSGGTYTIHIEGCMTDCLPLESCNDQFIMIEVIDTLFTGSLSPVEDEVGVRIYPNPASSYLTVQAEQPQIAYQIYDFTGKPLLSGILSAGQGEIALTDFHTGFYTIEFWKPSSLQRTVRKFTVIR